MQTGLDASALSDWWKEIKKGDSVIRRGEECEVVGINKQLDPSVPTVKVCVRPGRLHEMPPPQDRTVPPKSSDPFAFVQVLSSGKIIDTEWAVLQPFDPYGDLDVNDHALGDAESSLDSKTEGAAKRANSPPPPPARPPARPTRTRSRSFTASPAPEHRNRRDQSW